VAKRPREERQRHAFVFKFLRLAEAPVMSWDITEAWIAERCLRIDDATFVIYK